MTRIPLTLGKHYLLIDSPISFFLIDNEENSVYRPSGVWQLDTWKLLPEKYQKDHPVYTLSIEYDESKLADGKEVLIRESDIDLGDGVAGVSGQAVMLTGINDSLLPIPVSVSNLPDVQKVSVQNQPTEIAVSNLNSIPAYPTSIAVNNIPDVQNVNFCLRSECGFPNGEPLSYPEFINFLNNNQNIYIDCLVYRCSKGSFLISTWSLFKPTANSSVWVAVGRKFTDNTLDLLALTNSTATDETFAPFYHVI